MTYFCIFAAFCLIFAGTALFAPRRSWYGSVLFLLSMLCALGALSALLHLVNARLEA